MRLRPRSPSLFVTFTAWFLGVLLLGTLLHGVVVGYIARPLVQRWETGRAEALLQRLARDLEREFEAGANPDVRAILARARAADASLLLVYRPRHGPVVLDRELRPPIGPRFLHRLLQADSLRGPPVAPPPPHRPREHPRPDARVLGRQTVVVNGRAAGEIVALGVGPQFRFWPHPPGLAPLLFVPMAVLLAATAALVLFRVFLRRVRQLERMASRVAEGDLMARVADPGADEIGRLGSTLNRMAGRLEEARHQLEDSDRQRRQLFADITHELATPLTSIRGFAETLLDAGVPVSDAERQQYTEHIRSEAQRMDALLDDLLELTRLEAGAIPLDIERLDWTALCQHTMQRFEPRFRDAGITLAWRGTGESAWIHADGRRLEQVIDNLLGNALRYVPRGGRVEVSVEPSAANTYCLRVEDDGPGFPDADLPHVFERFYRGPNAAGQPGTGLGLAIVREIVRRHGGRVEPRNRVPHGAAIEIELPTGTALST